KQTVECDSYLSSQMDNKLGVPQDSVLEIKFGETSGKVFVSDNEHSSQPVEETTTIIPFQVNNNKNCTLNELKKWCQDRSTIPQDEDQVFVGKFEYLALPKQEFRIFLTTKPN
ncbi:unnamed protein product, partial [Brachionus calyciflorus]